MPNIIALAGHIASGKSKAAELLAREYGMEHIEYSSCLYAVLDIFDIPHTRLNIDCLSTFLRSAYGQDVFSRAVQKKLRETTSKWVVLSTIRRASDIESIRGKYPVRLWYVDAERRIRYERHVSSARKTGDADMSFEEFRRIEENEVQRSIPLLKTEAETIIENNNGYESFLDSVRHYADILLKKQ